MSGLIFWTIQHSAASTDLSGITACLTSSKIKDLKAYMDD